MIQITQKQKGALLLLGIAGILLVLILTLVLPNSGAEEPEQKASVTQPIPDGESIPSPQDKSDGYRRSEANINDYWDSLDDSTVQGDSQDEEMPSPRPDGRPKVETVDDLFGFAKEEPAPTPKAKKPAGGSPSKPTSGSTQKPAKTEPDAVAPEEPKPLVKRSDAISSLDEDVMGDLGNGFSSLDAGSTYISSDEGHPYKCMFTRSEKVHSGQRISVRLLEDLVIDGTLIPQNTHLSAVCSINNRMEILITSIDFHGKILKFKLEGYDTDGGKGIYCSDLSEGKRRATEQGISTVSTSLSSRLGRVANDAANVGASIIRSKTGEVTVEIPAGYVFYVIESKDRY